MLSCCITPTRLYAFIAGTVKKITLVYIRLIKFSSKWIITNTTPMCKFKKRANKYSLDYLLRKCLHLHVSARSNPSSGCTKLHKQNTYIYNQSLHFIPTKWTQYVKYIYLSPITSNTFRCLLHHLQGDHYVTFSKTICFLQCFWASKAIVTPEDGVTDTEKCKR